MWLAQKTQEADRALSYTLPRVVLGINILFHGVSRILAGSSVFAHSLSPKFAHTFLPAWMVMVFAISLPWIEAMIGILILFGLATRVAFTTGLLEIPALPFGSTLTQDWQAAGWQLLYALVFAVLFATRSYNQYSIDCLMKKTGAGGAKVVVWR